MNILNVTSIVEWRGGDAQMYTVYNLLKKYNDFNQFILCPENSVLAEICKRDQASYFTYKRENKVKSLIKPIQKIVKECKIDVLHIHDSSALSAAILAKLFSGSKVKIIYSRKRNNKIKNNFFSKLKYDNRFVEQIVCVSKAVEQIYHDVNMNPDKLLTIYDAIDVSKYENITSVNLLQKELNLSDDTKIVGNICSLAKQKDIYTFINTAKLVLENYKGKLVFVILGDGPLAEELKLYTKEIGLLDKIYFLGFRKNVEELLSEFDVMLMTSITEGLPLSIYEAFAAKVPIVSTRAGGIAEVVINGETGFVTDIKDSERLAKYTERLLMDKELSNKIKENSYQLVSTKFDLKNLEENYYNYYKTLS